MTWTKLSDDYSDDCWTLTDAAFRLHTEALVWSNRKLLDLVVPRSDLVRFSSRPEAATELVAVGWWTEEGDTYVIRHHARYQRKKADVLKQQEANRTNGGKGGRPPKPTREQAGTRTETQSVTESVRASHSEPLTERDRTGREWHQERDVAPSGIDPWATPTAPSPVTTLRPTCSGCGCDLATSLHTAQHRARGVCGRCAMRAAAS